MKSRGYRLIIYPTISVPQDPPSAYAPVPSDPEKAPQATQSQRDPPMYNLTSTHDDSTPLTSLQSHASKEENPLDTSGAPTDNTSKSALAQNYIQLSPHEKLSLERVQRIVNLNGFIGSSRSLDALTSRPYHKDRATNHRLCKPTPDITLFIQGHASYESDMFDSQFKKGLFVKINWQIDFDLCQKRSTNRKAASEICCLDL